MDLLWNQISKNGNNQIGKDYLSDTLSMPINNSKTLDEPAQAEQMHGASTRDRH